MKKRSLIFVGAGVLSLYGISSSYADLNCTLSPDCDTLGYTLSADDCADSAIKVACPTDTSKMFCKIPSMPILYGDGTVSREILSDKTPIGIVVDAENYLAVALTDINSSGAAGSTAMVWSGTTYDIPSLDNCTSSDSLTSCGTDGRANTTAILSCGSSCGTTPAATATSSYEPNGCSADFCKAGRWFLPSASELITLSNVSSEVEASLSLTASSGATTFAVSPYWVSTEYSSDSTWKFIPTSGARLNETKNATYLVRPFVYYGNETKTETGNVCTDEKWYLYLNFAGNQDGSTCKVQKADSSVILKSESGKEGSVTEIALSSGSLNAFNSWSNWAQISPDGGTGSDGYIGGGSSYIDSFSKSCTDTITGVEFHDTDSEGYIYRYVYNNSPVTIAWDYNDDVSCSGDVTLVITESYY